MIVCEPSELNGTQSPVSVPAISTPGPVFNTEHCADLTAIYEDFVSLCIWSLPVCKERELYARELAKKGFHFRGEISVTDDPDDLQLFPKGPGESQLTLWVRELANMYATLFGLNSVGLRISGVSRPMCPKFHVDHVPVRLVQSLSGDGSDWYSNPDYFSANVQERDSLSHWLKSAATCRPAHIHQAPSGAVVLMKGTKWAFKGNPVIHRSPAHNKTRLVLSMDFV